MGRRQASTTERLRGRILGRLVSNARKNKDISQYVLAETAEVNIDALRGIEQGRYAHPSFFTIMKIARVLELPVEKLYKLSKAMR